VNDAGSAARETVNRSNDTPASANDAVKDTANSVKDTADSVNATVGPVKDAPVSVKETAAAAGDTVDRAVSEIAGSTVRDAQAAIDAVDVTAGVSGIDTKTVTELQQDPPGDATGVTPLDDAGAPSPGVVVDTPSSGVVDARLPNIAEAGVVEKAAAGAESVPAAASPADPPSPLRSSGSLSGVREVIARDDRVTPAPSAQLETPPGANPTVAASVSPPPPASHESPTPRSHGSDTAASGIDLSLLAAAPGLTNLVAAQPSESAPSEGSSLRQEAPTAPPAGATGIAGGISAAASSTLLLVLASVLALWLAGPAFRLRPRIAAAPPVPFVSLLERPG